MHESRARMGSSGWSIDDAPYLAWVFTRMPASKRAFARPGPVENRAAVSPIHVGAAGVDVGEIPVAADPAAEQSEVAEFASGAGDL